MKALIWLSKAITAVLTVVRFFVTLPYQRLLIYNTVRPAQEIQELAGLDIEVPENRTLLLTAISAWRTGKQAELSFVAVAAAVMTAIITASFSWKIVETSHWTGPAFWYASLSLCISGIFLSSQQLSLLSLIQKKDLDVRDCDVHSAKVVIRRHLQQILAQEGSVPTPRPKPLLTDVEARAGETLSQEKTSNKAGAVVEEAPMMTAGESQQWVLSSRAAFVWQCSIMLIAYSTVFYMVGLSVVVCTPVLEHRKWDSDSCVAVTYLVSLGVSVWLFGFCSYGAYDYIYEGDDADRSFVEELVRRIKILSDGKDPMKRIRRRSALWFDRNNQEQDGISRIRSDPIGKHSDQRLGNERRI